MRHARILATAARNSGNDISLCFVTTLTASSPKSARNSNALPMRIFTGTTRRTLVTLHRYSYHAVQRVSRTDAHNKNNV